MASKLKMKQNLTAEGTIRIEENGQIFLEIEEIGDKSFAELFGMFQGQSIKLGVTTTEEIFE